MVGSVALLVGSIAGIATIGIVTFGPNSTHNVRDLQTQARATYGVHLEPRKADLLLNGYSTIITISSTRNGNTITDRYQLAQLGHQGDRTTLIVSGPVSRDVYPVNENAHELPR